MILVKKSVSILLVLMMTLSVMPVFAEGCELILTKQNETETGFDVVLSIKNNPGMSVVELTLDFDKDALLPVSIENAGIFEKESITSNLDPQSGNEPSNLKEIKFIWLNISGTKESGDMVKYSFSYKPGLTEKQTNVSINNNTNIIDKDYNKIVFTTNTLSVTVPADENAEPPAVEPEPETPPADNPTPSTPSEPSYTPPSVNPSPSVPSVPSYTPPVTENNVTLKNKNGVEKIKYMGVYDDKTFAPNKPATRYEVIEALNNLVDITATKYKDAFEDVEEKYQTTVKAFITAEILDGYEDGTFKGNNTITRAELVKILTVAFKLEEDKNATSEFTDIKGHWAESYIKTFVSNKYTFGYEDNTFRPENKVTRAEVVAFVNRIIKAEGELSTNVPADLNADHWAYNDILKAIK